MSNNIGMAIILAVVSVVVSVVVSLLITKTIITSGAKADTSLQIYRKEVFSNLTLAEISTTGAVVNTEQNVPGVLTTTGNVSTLTPFKIEKGKCCININNCKSRSIINILCNWINMAIFSWNRWWL